MRMRLGEKPDFLENNIQKHNQEWFEEFDKQMGLEVQIYYMHK